MGSCSSVHRSQEETTNNMKALRLSSFGSKTDKFVIPPSPIKDNIKPTVNNATFRVDDFALQSRWSPSKSTTTTTTFMDYANNGSKEEAFFDSKAWLDSDCEDDFYSVNGEFTPSRGTTPVHHTFGTPVVNNTPSENTIPGSAPEPSPTEKKKKLLELFRESVREDKDDDGVENTPGNEKKEDKPIIQDLLSKPARGTPYISGANSACSSERTMNEDHAYNTEKSVKSKQCCLPSLAACRSFSERRRRASPAIIANGKA